ncbi:alpha/beta hydrolase [Nitrospira sp. KM1]|nr:alpha/beta hydrolase [Nitrospira sp. KM1]
MIRGDRLDGVDRQVLFITGFLSKRWGNKSKALAQWCQERGWGFSCYDVRGFGDSDGRFRDYTLSDWIADARVVLASLQTGPPITVVGNSLGSWIAWLIAREHELIERLIMVAPAFNMMGVRAGSISEDRRQAWRKTGWMPWDDDPLHKDWPLAWKWVEESESSWNDSFHRLRPVKTTIVHGLQDKVIHFRGSVEFAERLSVIHPGFPVELLLVPGDHRLSAPEHMERLRRLVIEVE